MVGMLLYLYLFSVFAKRDIGIADLGRIFCISEFECVFQAQPLMVFITEIQRCAIIQGIPFCRTVSFVNAFYVGPLDADFWGIPGHAAFVVGMPEIVDFVAEFSYIYIVKSEI